MSRKAPRISLTSSNSVSVLFREELGVQNLRNWPAALQNVKQVQNASQKITSIFKANLGLASGKSYDQGILGPAAVTFLIRRPSAYLEYISDQLTKRTTCAVVSLSRSILGYSEHHRPRTTEAISNFVSRFLRVRPFV